RVRAEVTDFWAMVFNPSTVPRLGHTVLGAWQAGAFLVLSVSAYYLLKRRHLDLATRSFKFALSFAAVASVLQLLTGHSSAKVVARHQPAKLAAMEAHFPASAPAGLYLLGWVDQRNQQVSGVQVPGLLSWFVRGDTRAPVAGLNA